MENLKDNLINKINTQIKENKIKMKPKFFFIFQGFLLISFVFIMFLAILYIGNFILLIFHEHREALEFFHISNFNLHKFLDFIKMIPGLLILLFFIFTYSLYKLIKDYSFVYRKNILYTILVLFLILFVTIFNIHTFLDNDFKRIKFGEKGEIPGMIYLHKYYRKEHMPLLLPPKNDIGNYKKEKVDNEQDKKTNQKDNLLKS